MSERLKSVPSGELLGELYRRFTDGNIELRCKPAAYELIVRSIELDGWSNSAVLVLGSQPYPDNIENYDLDPEYDRRF